MAIDYTNRKFLKAESANSVKTCVYQKNNIIFQKGEMGDCMYEVLSGSVGIYIHYKEKNQLLLVEKQPGEFFGEIALLENRPRTATAVAMWDDTKMRVISSHGFHFYVREHPDNLTTIMDAMSDRFKEQRQEYFDACIALAEYKKAIESGQPISGELQAKVDRFLAEAERQGK